MADGFEPPLTEGQQLFCFVNKYIKIVRATYFGRVPAILF